MQGAYRASMKATTLGARGIGPRLAVGDRALSGQDILHPRGPSLTAEDGKKHRIGKEALCRAVRRGGTAKKQIIL